VRSARRRADRGRNFHGVRLHAAGARCRKKRSCASRRAGEFCDSVALADTVGYANPAQVKRLFSLVKKEIGDKAGRRAFPDTRGLGLANALAAYEEGVRHFDSSLGRPRGLSLCAGRQRNVITEDWCSCSRAWACRPASISMGC